MQILIAMLSFTAVFYAVNASYKILYRNRLLVHGRLDSYTTSEAAKMVMLDETLSKPFAERAIRPVLVKLATLTARMMPAKKRVSLHKKLLMAGNPGDLSPNEFLVIQYGLAVALPVVVILMMWPAGAPLPQVVTFGLLAGIIGFVIPDYYLKLKATQRKDQIQKTLPDVLDLLTVSVEAGLGFDAALVKVIEKIKGVLSDEFNRVLQEIKMGKPRRDALRDLGNRTGVDDLITFVGAIIQADQLGVSIGNVLRLQSEQMRQKRRQRAEEKAMKAPIKMLIPLILFIFPTVFIVLLGPAIIEIVQTMGG